MVLSANELKTVKRRTSTRRSCAAIKKARSRRYFQCAACLSILSLSVATPGCLKRGDDLASLETNGAKVTRNAEGQVTSIAIFASTDTARVHFAQLGGRLDHLQELTLQGHAINDEWLRELRQINKLRQLHLQNTKVTDAGLPHINALTSLEVVDLTFCDLVTDAGIAELDGLINLRTLNLDNSRSITDESLTYLHSMDSLESLSIADTNVTDEGLRMLVGTTIQALHAGGTQVTDDGLVHLRNLTQLRHLHLDNTLITDAGLMELGSLIYLRNLDLDGNQITDQGLECLHEMNSLRSLNLVSTDVTPEGIERLKQRLDNNIAVQHGGVSFQDSQSDAEPVELDNDVVVPREELPFKVIASEAEPIGLDNYVVARHAGIPFHLVKTDSEPLQNPTVFASPQSATLAINEDLAQEDLP